MVVHRHRGMPVTRLHPTSDRVRRNVFIVFSSVYLTITAINYVHGLVDDCLLAYSSCLLASATCTAIYTWWWCHTGEASDVYKWVTALMATIALNMSLSVAGRLLYLHAERDEYRNFLDSWVWELRNVPEVLVLIFMLALIIGRLS